MLNNTEIIAILKDHLVFHEKEVSKNKAMYQNLEDILSCEEDAEMLRDIRDDEVIVKYIIELLLLIE